MKNKVAREHEEEIFSVARQKLDNEVFSINEVQVKTVSRITFKKPFYDASMGPFSTWDPNFVRLVDSSGKVGECEMPKLGMPFFEELLLPIILNSEKLSYSDLYKKMYWKIRNEGFRGTAALILGHLDRVFCDLAAKREGLPLYKYLGGTNPNVRVYGSGLGTNIEGNELSEEALSWEERGFSTIKMKFSGFETSLSEDISRVAGIREVLKPETQLAIDANQVMSLKRAKAFVKELEISDLDIAWLEEPIHSGAFCEIEELCNSTEIKISYGESERTAKSFPSLIKAGVRHLQPVAGHICSISEYFDIVNLAKAHDLMMSSGGNSFYNATFNAVGQEDSLLEFLEPVVGPLAEIYKTYPTISNGKFILNDSLGFGVEVNWEKLEKENRVTFKESWKQA